MKLDALKLAEKLQEMAVLYGRFHELLAQEQVYLVNSNTLELAEVVKEKERVAEKVQSAEEERLALLDRIAEMMKTDRRSIKVDDVAALLEKKDAVELLDARNALRTALAQVKALNEINNQLLQHSMQYVRSAFEIVAGKKDQRQGYGNNGMVRMTVKVERNLVNTRA
jgi:flagellar biosynthesis/type III secretory pathway chaperone